jgi:DNA-directed RNA polymerase subunit RPC12/RpoP
VESEKTIGNVIYECMRCGTPVSNEELSRLPEIKTANSKTIKGNLISNQSVFSFFGLPTLICQNQDK